MHHLGEVMHKRLDEIRKVVFEVRQEPSPSVEAGDVWRHSYPPFPEVTEPTRSERPTRVQYNEALNLALHRIFEDGGATGKGAAMWGQDVGHRGGIFQVSAGLKDRFPELVRDAPINEPMIIGTAVGAALHQDLTLLPEIQFGDYTLNCLHWLVHLGNLYWSSNGQAAANVTLRTPVDPVSGGAIYHSMSVDGFYGGVPGLVITMPSTAYDAYGLLRTAADYRGPVLQLEPKRMYRLRLGHAMPGEPDDGKTLQNLRRTGELFPIDDYRIPIGSACQRRAGSDLTILAWGWAMWQSVEAADALAESHGVEAEVIDLRTLVPYDREMIYAAAQRTGRVIIAQNDRTFAGFGRQIQGDLIEAYPGISVRVIGQLNTPAVAQSRVLEDAITLQVSDIKQAMVEMMESKPQAWMENELHWLAHAPSRKIR
jgi:2-oxoisovalerate dehydrogenase E1 component